MRYFGPGAEGFVLIPAGGQTCSKSGCLVVATHILVGRENNLIEFYCFEHGSVLQDTLESKYQFDKDNQKGRPKVSRPKQRYRLPPRKSK